MVGWLAAWLKLFIASILVAHACSTPGAADVRMPRNSESFREYPIRSTAADYTGIRSTAADYTGIRSTAADYTGINRNQCS